MNQFAYINKSARHARIATINLLRGVLSKLQQQAMDVISDLDVKECKVASGQLSDKVLVLAQFVGTLRLMISKAANMDKQNIGDGIVEEMEQMIQEGLAHRTGMTEAIKEAKASKE